MKNSGMGGASESSSKVKKVVLKLGAKPVREDGGQGHGGDGVKVRKGGREKKIMGKRRSEVDGKLCSMSGKGGEVVAGGKRSVGGAVAGRKSRVNTVTAGEIDGKRRVSTVTGEEVGGKRRVSTVTGGEVGGKRRVSTVTGGEVGGKRKRNTVTGGEAGGKRKRNTVTAGEVGGKRRVSAVTGGEVGKRRKRSCGSRGEVDRRKEKGLPLLPPPPYVDGRKSHKLETRGHIMELAEMVVTKELRKNRAHGSEVRLHAANVVKMMLALDPDLHTIIVDDRKLKTALSDSKSVAKKWRNAGGLQDPSVKSVEAMENLREKRAIKLTRNISWGIARRRERVSSCEVAAGAIGGHEPPSGARVIGDGASSTGRRRSPTHAARDEEALESEEEALDASELLGAREVAQKKKGSGSLLWEEGDAALFSEEPQERGLRRAQSDDAESEGMEGGIRGHIESSSSEEEEMRPRPDHRAQREHRRRRVGSASGRSQRGGASEAMAPEGKMAAALEAMATSGATSAARGLEIEDRRARMEETRLEADMMKAKKEAAMRQIQMLFDLHQRQPDNEALKKALEDSLDSLKSIERGWQNRQIAKLEQAKRLA